MLIYYITDRKTFPGDEATRCRCLLNKIEEAAQAGIDYVQLREKDLCARDLEALAREAVRIVQESRPEGGKVKTALLINSRTDVALAAGAAGVHLPAHDVSPKKVRAAWQLVRAAAPSPVIGASCHSPEETIRAAADGATFAVLAPVFEKANAVPVGLEALRLACGAIVPVLALGGVTLRNARDCMQAGAAGIAGIRLFQEDDVAEVVRQLRS